MKKLNKLILLVSIITLTLSTPFKVLAEENKPKPETEQVQEQTEKPVEEKTEEEKPKPETEKPSNEGVPVDEKNNNPFIDTKEEEEKKDQSIRDKEIINRPIETPASVTGERYKGSGTVVDFTTTGSKAFYTVKAQDNSVYYIVIDMDMTENNVYFMSEINGEELTLNDITTKNQETENKPKPPTQPTKKKGSNPVFWIVFIGAIGLFGYQFFFGKLKNLNPLNKDDEKEEKSENNNMENSNIYKEDELDDEFLVDDEDDE